MRLLERWFSLTMSLVWAVVTVIGYFFWSWDLGQTIVFINIGFFSLFFNYYITLSELSFKDSIINAITGKRDAENLSRPLVVIGQVFSFLFNQFLFTCALGIACIIAGSIITAYFYNVLQVKTFAGMIEKWNGQWTNVILVSVILLMVEYVGFRIDFKKYVPKEVTTWSAFMPFSKNSKYKVVSYLIGSVVAVSIDGIVHRNDFDGFGSVCLIWMFICNFLWAYFDVIHPPTKVAIEQYYSEE